MNSGSSVCGQMKAVLIVMSIVFTEGFLMPGRSMRLASNRLATEEDAPVKRFIEAMEFLGPMRFITVGDTAILETVAEVEAVSYKKMADGTTMATLKSLDAAFEAHLRLETLKKVTMDTKATTDRNLYAIRFINKERDDPCLTCLLHSEDGTEPDESTLKYWQGLRDHYGSDFLIEQ